LFLILAPPLEISNLYLPILGRIAQFAKDPAVPDRLMQLQTSEELLALLDEKGCDGVVTRRPRARSAVTGPSWSRRAQGLWEGCFCSLRRDAGMASR
jgi:hypothetical protein